MKILTIVLSSVLLSQVFFMNGYAELDASTSQLVYAPGEPLFVYGDAEPNEPIIIRLYAPDGTIAEFEQVMTKSDGSFQHSLFDWAEPSPNLPFGSYILEIISNQQGGMSKTFDIKFSSTSELANIPIERTVKTTVFAPETGAVGSLFRVFVQTSSDGLLVGDDPRRFGSGSQVAQPSGLYGTEDGEVMITIGSEGMYRRFCEKVLKRPDLLKDPRFATNSDRIKNKIEMDTLLMPIFGAMKNSEAITRMHAASIPCGEVLGVRDAL